MSAPLNLSALNIRWPLGFRQFLVLLRYIYSLVGRNLRRGGMRLSSRFFAASWPMAFNHNFQTQTSQQFPSSFSIPPSTHWKRGPSIFTSESQFKRPTEWTWLADILVQLLKSSIISAKKRIRFNNFSDSGCWKANLLTWMRYGFSLELSTFYFNGITPVGMPIFFPDGFDDMCAFWLVGHRHFCYWLSTYRAKYSSFIPFTEYKPQ